MLPGFFFPTIVITGLVSVKHIQLDKERRNLAQRHAVQHSFVHVILVSPGLTTLNKANTAQRSATDKKYIFCKKINYI